MVFSVGAASIIRLNGSLLKWILLNVDNQNKTKQKKTNKQDQSMVE